MRHRLIVATIGLVGFAGRVLGPPLGRVVGSVINGFVAVAPSQQALAGRLAEQGALLFATSGGRPTAHALARQAGRSRRSSFALRAHGLLLRLGEPESAREVSSRLDGRVDAAVRLRLAAQEAVATGDYLGALASIGSADRDDKATRALRLHILRSLGRAEDVLRHADPSVVHDDLVADYRFDALWDLGRVDDALCAIDAISLEDLRSVDSLRRIRDAHRYHNGARSPVLDRIVAAAAAQPDWLATVLFELDRVGDLIELAEDPDFLAALGPSGLFQVARARYVSRDFEGALGVLQRLRATGRKWDAEKLIDRIELERGISAATLQRRLGARRPGEGFDEVVYLGLHQLGRHVDAFDRFLQDTDRRRLIDVFGDRADLSGRSQVGRRLVLPQGGPGDEILMAAAYPELVKRADRTEAACDPRLRTLLGRSFPNIVFHPCHRRASRSVPGFMGDGCPPRADHVLYEQLDESLDAVARSCDQVIFGRSLGRLLADVLPVAPYLVPDAELVASLVPRLSGGVGVVWRSEFNDAIRSIHYLKPEDLRPLVALDRPLVCLQHDVRSRERDTLSRVFGSSMIFLDDLDLRDDFETLAAVVSSLETVIGIGTTVIELAGALGTRAITMHPNLVGAWRRRGTDGDQWHQTMSTAIAADLGRPIGAVEEAVRVARSFGL